MSLLVRLGNIPNSTFLDTALLLPQTWKFLIRSAQRRESTTEPGTLSKQPLYICVTQSRNSVSSTHCADRLYLGLFLCAATRIHQTSWGSAFLSPLSELGLWNSFRNHLQTQSLPVSTGLFLPFLAKVFRASPALAVAPFSLSCFS